MNKAIILAGGKGTRLAPLTDGMPKPLIPFHGESLCKRIISQLSHTGITEIMISVGHLGEMIKQNIGTHCNGVLIKYLEESVPLGTAGGLKYADKLLGLSKDEPVLIIAGDCVCDYNFSDIIQHHKNSGADATVVTAECDNPLEYGIVLSDSNGNIRGFNEKPPWSQVNCNRVNTGIYVINSSVAGLIPPGQYDFSKDLFPKMLQSGYTLSEFRAQGYWCDIGIVESYYKCCIDALNGKLKDLDTSECADYGTLEANGVTIISPCYIHKSCKIGRNTVIGPNTSLGKNCIIGENVSLAGSILHDNCVIETGSRVEGTIACRNVTVGKNCSIGGGTVIAANVKISAGSIVSGNTCITQHRRVKTEKSCFCANAMNCDDNGVVLGSACEFSPDACELIGRAVVTACGGGARIGIMNDTTPFSALFAQAILLGIQRSGAVSYNFGEGFEKLASFCASRFSADCFLYIKTINKKVVCKIFNKNGLAPSRDYERRLEKAIAQPLTANTAPVYTRAVEGAELLYCNELLTNAKAYTSGSFDKIKAAFVSRTSPREFAILKKVFLDMGGEYTDHKTATEHSGYIIHYDENRGISVEQGNYTVDKYHMAAAIIKAERERGANSFALPYLAPQTLREYYGNSSILFFPQQSGKRFNIPRHLIESCYWAFDDIFLCARFLSLIAHEKKNISEYFHNSPGFAYKETTFKLPDNLTKTVVIGKLSDTEETSMLQDTYEGIKINFPNGCVTVVPGKANAFKLYSEALNAEIADELCEKAKNMITEDIGNCNK